jgi:hypothetical protein
MMHGLCQTFNALIINANDQSGWRGGASSRTLLPGQGGKNRRVDRGFTSF